MLPSRPSKRGALRPRAAHAPTSRIVCGRVYAERRGKHADAYAFIELRKHQLFPSTFEYTYRSPDEIETTTTQVLFGDLIAAVEHATDQKESVDAKPTRAPDFKPGTNAQRRSLHRSKHGHSSGHGSQHGSGSLGRMSVANLFRSSTRSGSDSDSLASRSFGGSHRCRSSPPATSERRPSLLYDVSWKAAAPPRSTSTPPRLPTMDEADLAPL